MVGGANIEFRLGVPQKEKLSAVDALKKNMVNLRISAVTSITIPTRATFPRWRKELPTLRRDVPLWNRMIDPHTINCSYIWANRT